MVRVSPVGRSTQPAIGPRMGYLHGVSSEPTPPSFSPHVVPSVYLTGDVPGTGGRLKERPGDFLVEEIPAYDPVGRGEHIYLMVQKTGMATLQMVNLIARHFGVPTHAVGYAGLKDKVAITRQLISVHTPGKTAADFPSIQHPKVTVLWADQHENKLRRGHLRGNRFSIRVRGVEPGKVVLAKRVLDRLERCGVPNRLGEQRFGFALNNHRVGRAVILGDFESAVRELLAPPGDTRPGVLEQQELFRKGRYADAVKLMPDSAETERAAMQALARGATAEQAIAAIGPTQRTFLLSSIQSAIFNALLDRRLIDGSFDRLLTGDLAFKHDNGAIFLCDEQAMNDASTAERLGRLEISPSGPMWGALMPRPVGRPAEMEAAALAEFSLKHEDFGAFEARTGEVLKGDRRPLRVPVAYPDVEGGVDEFGPYIRCAFELPPGSFATVVMREVIKPELAGASPEGMAEGDER